MSSKTTAPAHDDMTHDVTRSDPTLIPEERPAPEPRTDLSTPPPTPEMVTVRADQLQSLIDRMEALERQRPAPLAFNVDPATLSTTATYPIGATTSVHFGMPNSTPETAAAALSAPDASGFRDIDLVTVLHGWGRIDPERVEGKSGVSKKVYRSRGGVVRDVLYSDARYWQQQWGSKFVKILPRNASEADFAQATGLAQQIDTPKLVALLESADLSVLVHAWGVDRALAWIQRLAAVVEEVGAAQAPQARPARHR